MSQPTARVAADAVVLRQFQAKMAFFHDAWRGDDAGIARDEDGFGIAVAQRLELAQPASEHGVMRSQRQLSVDVQEAFGLARGEAFVGAVGRGGA